MLFIIKVDSGLYNTSAIIIAIKNDAIFIADFINPCLYPINVNNAIIKITIKSNIIFSSYYKEISSILFFDMIPAMLLLKTMF